MPENIQPEGEDDAPTKLFSVSEGDVITVDCLEWIDPYWEFDNPTVVLRPIYREYETTHTDGAIEDVLLDLCCDGPVPVRHGPPQRWNEKTLRQRFREALGGKEFPQRNYRATRQVVRITHDGEGLTWEEVPSV